MMEATVEDTTLDALVTAVDDLRAEGRSVAAACRVVGISTSTYYRRRRSAGAAGQALALAASAPARDWPFVVERPAETPRAPVFWDQAFSAELTDSYVRREFGGGGPKTRPGRALEALAASRTGLVRARRLVARLSAGPLGVAAPALLAIIAVAAVGLAAGWAVSVAANPAAWPQPQDLAALRR